MQSTWEELSGLKRIGVLQSWSNSKFAALIVVGRKQNDSVRLCANFSTNLNAALEDNHHSFPAAEDILTTFNIGTCFEKMDLPEAFVQVKFKPECRENLTVKKRRGLYQFIRFPFGVKTTLRSFET